MILSVTKFAGRLTHHLTCESCTRSYCISNVSSTRIKTKHHRSHTYLHHATSLHPQPSTPQRPTKNHPNAIPFNAPTTSLTPPLRPHTHKSASNSVRYSVFVLLRDVGSRTSAIAAAAAVPGIQIIAQYALAKPACSRHT